MLFLTGKIIYMWFLICYLYLQISKFSVPIHRIIQTRMKHIFKHSVLRYDVNTGWKNVLLAIRIFMYLELASIPITPPPHTYTYTQLRSQVCIVFFFFFNKVGSTPSMGLEFRTLRSGVACSTDWTSQVPPGLYSLKAIVVTDKPTSRPAAKLQNKHPCNHIFKRKKKVCSTEISQNLNLSSIVPISVQIHNFLKENK